jgi:hypothetical protein
MRQRRRYRRTSLETYTSTLPLISYPKSKFTALKAQNQTIIAKAGIAVAG